VLVFFFFLFPLVVFYSFTAAVTPSLPLLSMHVLLEHHL
jgi:hypothetical protein